MDVTAYIGSDGAIYLRGRRPALLDGEDGRPLGEAPLVRVGPGEEFEGRTFEEWRALLEADIARKVARWHSLSRKRGRARRACRSNVWTGKPRSRTAAPRTAAP
jgi:hypothetical protein